MSLIEFAPATMPATPAPTPEPWIGALVSRHAWHVASRPTRLELPVLPAEPTVHTTPDSDGIQARSREQRKEDTSLRSLSDGCAKVKAKPRAQ